MLPVSLETAIAQRWWFCSAQPVTLFLMLRMLSSSYSLQDTQDETAVLWLDETQDGIQKANRDTEESQRCKHCGKYRGSMPLSTQYSSPNGRMRARNVHMQRKLEYKCLLQVGVEVFSFNNECHSLSISILYIFLEAYVVVSVVLVTVLHPRQRYLLNLCQSVWH